MVSTGDKWSLNKPLDVLFAGDAGVKIESSDNHSSLFIDSHTAYGQYIRFTENNANKYWINSASGKLVFRPAATTTVTSQVVFDASGNVGIGIDSPSHKLHVKNDNDYAAKFGGTGGGDYSIEIGQGTTNSSAGFNATGNSGSMLFKISDSEKMRIKYDGNVGIGTDSPDAKLRIDQDAATVGLKVTGGSGGVNIAEFIRDVGADASVIIGASSGDPQIKFTSPSNTFSIGVNSNTFEIADNASLGANTRFSITNTGNVGIGTTNPSEKLVVNVDSAGIKSGLILNNEHEYGSGVGVASTALQFGRDNTPANGQTIITGQIYSGNEVETTSNPCFMAFSTKSGASPYTLTERMRIDSSGNVGIGVSSPSSALDVRGSGNVDVMSKIINTGQTSDGRKTEFLFGKDNGANLSGVLKYVYDTTQADRRIDLVHYGTSNGISILDGGDVGIGTTAVTSPGLWYDANPGYLAISHWATPPSTCRYVALIRIILMI